MELTKFKERPILFSGDMIRAILEDRKTQTRRALKKQPLEIIPGVKYSNNWITLDTRDPNHGSVIKCRFGIPGDHLWVRETYTIETWGTEFGEPNLPKGRSVRFHDAENEYESSYWEWPHYRATDPAPELFYEDDPNQGDEPRCKWVPSIFMPRWASRITLEISFVKVERLQDMKPIDCVAEGIYKPHMNYGPAEGPMAIAEFANLWDSLNAKRGFGWETNPWVWVIEFRRLQSNY